MPERTANPEELPLGFLLPGGGSGEKAEAMRRRASAAAPRLRAALPRAIGAAATLLGWVLPQKAEKGIPLIADSAEDFAVVRSLLTMHYAGFDRDERDDEYDDSDPTQKDFLFGALLREVGAALRGDGLLETLRLAVAIQWERLTPPTRAALALLRGVHRRVAAADGARIADTWTALNHGRDPLIQYLFLELDPQAGEQGLTIRGDAPALFRRSRALADAAFARQLTGEPAALRQRILDLAEMMRAAVADPAESRRATIRRAAVVACVAIVALGFAVRSAVVYDPVYQARMHEAEAKLAAEKETPTPPPQPQQPTSPQGAH
jgi:hypothetical protein